MAVYTSISQVEVDDLSQQYGLGTLTRFQGIAAGVENSNYLLRSTDSAYILTLFETLGREQLPWFHDLLRRYQDAGIPTAPPLATRSGDTVIEVAGKPCALFPLLAGEHLHQPHSEHCHHLGETLARMHLAAVDHRPRSAWDLDMSALQRLADRVRPKLPADQAPLLEKALQQARRNDYGALPTGTIHGDLFRDNVLFVGNRVSGILDPYTAHYSTLIYDLAVAATDWCSTPDAEFDPGRMDALLQGYSRLRPLTDAETANWKPMLASACLRYWLSRLRDWHFPRPGELIEPRQPDYFARLLSLTLAV